ncbi:MAG TPA: hypothetical protein VKA79_12315 [Aestuariivirgaceae bacterium]|nr:hypothetical protein [Aestuariivirgaceae bacterium]
MNLNRRERELLKTVIGLFEKVLAPKPIAGKGKGPRQRRSRADAVKLQKRVLAARRRNRSVAAIAEELGITPAYVYQLLR